MKAARIFFTVFAVVLSFMHAASAYEAMEVKNGGAIEGVVEFSGARPPLDPMLTLTSENEECGKSIPAKKYLIRDNKIQNVVVSVRGIRAGKPLPREAIRVTNKKCEFIPRIALGFKGNELTIRNDDPVLHTFDVHLSQSGKELFHASLHEKGTSVTKTIRTTGQLTLSCYVHPWQSAAVIVFDQPYAAMSDEQGRFLIKDIPAGTYTIDAWHEGLGTSTATVTVESGKTSAIRLKYVQ